jgi:hypothetical protein
MTQAQLDRAVADATGESRRTIRQLGFSLVGPASGERRGSDVAKFLDWDRVQRARYAHFAVF